MSFENLNLNPAIIKAIHELGFTTPTPIQEQAIPELILGHDVMASAQTGTGKTAAFMLPALNRLATPAKIRGRGPRVLVLTPTRELALQVSDATSKFGKYLSNTKVVSILGGMSYPLQNKLLSQAVDILVATPGRLIDHIHRGRIDFSRLEMLVLDEADRMLDMGFIEDVEAIASRTPDTRQTLLFSATLDSSIDKIALRLLKSPKRIQVAPQHAKLENIEQKLHYVDDLSHKNRLLNHLLQDELLKQAIVFTATKRDADTLADSLALSGYEVAALHGDMNQRERTRTLTRLRNGNLRILVATDVAARGIDVSSITHVINFDLPKFAEDYVHRIGRTGRAGAAGVAVSFATGKDSISLKKIERFTGQTIAPFVVPGMEAKYKPRTGGRSHSRDQRMPNVTHKRNRSWGDGNQLADERKTHNHSNPNQAKRDNRTFNDFSAGSEAKKRPARGRGGFSAGFNSFSGSGRNSQPRAPRFGS